MSSETVSKEAQVITLTPNAVNKIKSLTANDPQAQGKFLRIFLEAGGCSGYQYGFTYDAQKEGDQTATFDGVTVLVDPQSAPMLKGSIIDYKEEFGGEGFAIQNPNVKKSCGCGNSVEV
jgi:iron-sulfur cluster assembly accessory protein